MSDSELRNLRGGSSRRENERPTPTRKSNFRKAQIDFLPSPLGEGRKKVAFTLAEVLITLGIIGVVAALTLPTLISNYQKQVYVNQLKKSVSSLSQGFTLMMGKDGVTELKDTEAFSKTHPFMTVCSAGFINNDAICKNFREALYETFAGITINQENIKYKDLNGTEHNLTNDNVINFPDGSYIFGFSFYLSRNGFQGGTMKGSMGEFLIDINGSKNPNTVGRDIFQLNVGNVGGVYPLGSHATSELTNGNPDQSYWRTATNELYTCKSDGVSSGYGCAARVLEEGKMDY